MKLLKKTYVYIIATILFSSCAVTNNFYVHNANPREIGEGKINLALSSGLQPQIDSIGQNEEIYFSEKLTSNVNLNVGVETGIAKNLSLRAAVHLPNVVGGFGLRGGLQYSFLPINSKFNIALGADAGFVISKDSARIFGDSKIGASPHTKGALNADFFVPITYNFTDDFTLNLAARYSFNSFRIKYNNNTKKAYGYNPQAVILGLGIRYKELYLEVNTIHLDDGRLIPSFGVGAIFSM